MRVLFFVMTLAAASPVAADCQQQAEIEVVPGAHVIGLRDYDMTGRPVSAKAMRIAVPDIFQATVMWRGWRSERELTFAVAWPESPMLLASLAAKPRWVINLGQYRHVAGKYIAVEAVGSRGTWRGRWTLTNDHAIFIGPSPRAFKSVTLALHNADGSLETKRSFELPDWKAFNRRLPAAQVRLKSDLAGKAEQCLHPPLVSPPPVR